MLCSASLIQNVMHLYSYAERCYAECRYACGVMVNVVMRCAVMLNDVMLSGVMLNVVTLIAVRCCCYCQC